jgi:hypothetical protein
LYGFLPRGARYELTALFAALLNGALLNQGMVQAESRANASKLVLTKTLVNEETKESEFIV